MSFVVYGNHVSPDSEEAVWKTRTSTEPYVAFDGDDVYVVPW